MNVRGYLAFISGHQPVCIYLFEYRARGPFAENNLELKHRQGCVNFTIQNLTARQLFQHRFILLNSEV